MRLGGAECGQSVRERRSTVGPHPCCADANGTALDDGRTMVWPYYVNGRPKIRCFMPDSMT
ncbi:hypothetical protein [Bradyrhizobium sp. SUTN9-2]|uniref:hypothetical protein n=1 Tax=Bradyrhizobium sp. SUTN9-2 TaxID=1167456 RepID=UPI000D650722|nr:hypothetical protein [Bradyrhizobium sp. SUTN9-2]